MFFSIQRIIFVLWSFLIVFLSSICNFFSYVYILNVWKLCYSSALGRPAPALPVCSAHVTSWCYQIGNTHWSWMLALIGQLGGLCMIDRKAVQSVSAPGRSHWQTRPPAFPVPGLCTAACPPRSSSVPPRFFLWLARLGYSLSCREYHGQDARVVHLNTRDRRISPFNGSGRFPVPANLRGHTGRRQPGHRRCSRRRVSMAERQAAGSHGGVCGVSFVEDARGAGFFPGVASSNPGDLDLCGARHGLRRTASGSSNQHTHGGRSRGWNHGALPYVPHRLCQGITAHIKTKPSAGPTGVGG